MFEDFDELFQMATLARLTGGFMPSRDKPEMERGYLLLTHLLRTEEGQEFAMICRHSGFDGYLRLFPDFPYNFRIFEEFRDF
jgi:hypothetical protein